MSGRLIIWSSELLCFITWQNSLKLIIFCNSLSCRLLLILVIALWKFSLPLNCPRAKIKRYQSASLLEGGISRDVEVLVTRLAHKTWKLELSDMILMVNFTSWSSISDFNLEVASRDMQANLNQYTSIQEFGVSCCITLMFLRSTSTIKKTRTLWIKREIQKNIRHPTMPKASKRDWY